MEIASKCTTIPSFGPLFISQGIADGYKHEFADLKGSEYLHYLWFIPLNVGANLLGAALQPLVSLVAIVAAAVFELISCFVEGTELWPEAKSARDLALRGASSILHIYVLFVRVVYPTFQYEEYRTFFNPPKALIEED